MSGNSAHEVREVRERLARVEARLDEIEKRLDRLEALLARRNGYLKWMALMTAMILSFVAAMFGLGWRPPG